MSRAPPRGPAALSVAAVVGCTGVLGLDDHREARDAICEQVEAACPRPPGDCRTQVDAAPVGVVGAVASHDCTSIDACAALIECLVQAGLPLCAPLLAPCERDEECCAWASADVGAACITIPLATQGHCTRFCQTNDDCPGGSCLIDVALCTP